MMNVIKTCKEKIKEHKNLFIFLYCLILSAVCLFFCTKSSPFYALNDWCDANTYFTIGKSMLYGLVPYRDLFEQKGPLLYVIHEIACIISKSSFLGVYVLEVISFSIFLYFMNKIITLYCKKRNVFWGLACISFTILSSFVFASGDSAEEFCISFLAVSLYYLLKYFKTQYPKPIDKKELIINGILAGCVLWIKYTMLGFWIGFMLFIVLSRIIKKEYKEALLSCLYFLIGMIIATIPWIIYFGINNALDDLVYTYFYVNMTAYSSNISIIHRILSALKSALAYSRHFPIFLIISSIGYVFFMIDKKMIPNILGKFAITFSMILTAIGVYYGNNYRYYFLFLMPFMVLGIASIGFILDKLIDKKDYKFKNVVYGIINLVTIIIFIFLTYKLSPNRIYHDVSKEDMIQYKFAKHINEAEDKSLLNYNFIDGGFYTATSTIPNIKYFSMPNIAYESYPIIRDEQNRYIKEKVTEFVICKVEENENVNVPFLNENYKEIETEKIFDENICYKYVLYQKINEIADLQ